MRQPLPKHRRRRKIPKIDDALAGYVAESPPGYDCVKPESIWASKNSYEKNSYERSPSAKKQVGVEREKSGFGPNPFEPRTILY
jgi:hypothetical protein